MRCCGQAPCLSMAPFLVTTVPEGWISAWAMTIPGSGPSLTRSDVPPGGRDVRGGRLARIRTRLQALSPHDPGSAGAGRRRSMHGGYDVQDPTQPSSSSRPVGHVPESAPSVAATVPSRMWWEIEVA